MNRPYRLHSLPDNTHTPYRWVVDFRWALDEGDRTRISKTLREMSYGVWALGPHSAVYFEHESDAFLFFVKLA